MSTIKSRSFLLLLSITSCCVLSHAVATASASTVVFSDAFGGDSYSTPSVVDIIDASSRNIDGGVTDVSYGFYEGTSMNGSNDALNVSSGEFVDDLVKINDGVLQFSAATDTDYMRDRVMHFRKKDSLGADVGQYDWGSHLGKKYDISFTYQAGGLSIGISDTAKDGFYKYNKSGYNNFGMYTWGTTFNLGGNRSTVEGDGYEGSKGYAKTGDVYHVTISIDETGQSETEDSDVRVLVMNNDGAENFVHSYKLNFVGNERYIQFYARDSHGGFLDNLEIKTYAVPEFNNFTLLTALFLVTGLFAFRRNPQL